jgi:uncharacterized surface protein with fasciclin (FAS1) repeats
MKKRTMIPLAFAAMIMYGCAGSTETMDDTTAMDETTTMSETQTMAGSATDTEQSNVDAMVIEEKVVVPVATLSITTLPMENTVEVDNMFEDIDDTKQHDVLALAKTNPNLSTFMMLAEQADLESDLQRLDEFTLFAPTNEAFSKVPQEKLESLLMPDNLALLKRVLQAHVLPSKVSATQFNSSQRIQMSEDSYIPVDVTMNGTNITVGGATIVKDNVEASNGMIHVVDNVILPTENTTETGVR